MKDLIPRVLSGIVYAILIFFGTTTNIYVLIGLMTFFFAVCFIEFAKITSLNKLYLFLGIIGSIFVLYYYISNVFSGSLLIFDSLNLIAPILFAIAGFTILFFTEELETGFGKATISVAYLCIPFALAMTIPTEKYDLGKLVITKEILFIFIIIWISDTFAYFIGSKFGKHKLAPKISPKKSWEGFFGGLILSIVGGIIIQQYFATNLKGNWIVISIIIALCAPIGDLIESKLKRFFDAKDSGKLIPGHGGFLDRLDSFIFVVPFVYVYYLIIGYL